MLSALQDLLISPIIRFTKGINSSFPIRLRTQEKLYESIGLFSSRNLVLDKLNCLLNDLGFPPYSESINMYSEHLLLFTAISLSSLPIRRILEIGTYDGRTSVLLSCLFPNAHITTLDLPPSDPIFSSSYNRSDPDILDSFIHERDTLLSSCPNISFLQVNSLVLTTFIETYDLIWVDGAHGYPHVTSDITNSLRLLNDNGIIMCDDVYFAVSHSDGLYNSIAAFQTINSFMSANMLSCTFIPKRIGYKFLHQDKYIAFITKTLF
jgi:hypothetical protein